MKTTYCLALGLLFSTHLIAQTNSASTNTPVSFPPSGPLPQSVADHIAKMTSLFDGKTLDGWKFHSRSTNHNTINEAWTVKDGAIASLGPNRNELFTDRSFGDYRLIFNMRHVGPAPGTKGDHRACVLLFCTAPAEGEKGLDALGGIQFQVPNGGNWDYRPGKNKGGGPNFTKVPHPTFNEKDWSQVEILVNTKGTIRMAVAQPPGTTAYEVLDFNDPTAGKTGPIGLQIHNPGLIDEYKDIRIETDPKEDKLITLGK